MLNNLLHTICYDPSSLKIGPLFGQRRCKGLFVLCNMIAIVMPASLCFSFQTHKATTGYDAKPFTLESESLTRPSTASGTSSRQLKGCGLVCSGSGEFCGTLTVCRSVYRQLFLRDIQARKVLKVQSGLSPGRLSLGSRLEYSRGFCWVGTEVLLPYGSQSLWIAWSV